MASAEVKASTDAEPKDAPDSWELDDVDVRLKTMNLKPASEGAGAADGDSKPEKAVATSAWDGQPITEAPQTPETGPMQKAVSSDDLRKQAKDFMVDNFLYEALQNPRDRLAVLRMEQEVLKFLKDPQQLLMEFSPMPTSYHRAAAHRVAQHYYLVTTAVDSGDASTVVARKTAIGGPVKYPPVKLLDIPIAEGAGAGGDAAGAASGAGGMTAAQLKRAIMQRPKDDKAQASAAGGAGSSTQMQSSSSVEKRQEEYNKARARIFASSSSSSSSSSSLTSSAPAPSASGSTPAVSRTSTPPLSSPSPSLADRLPQGYTEASQAGSQEQEGAAGAASAETGETPKGPEASPGAGAGAEVGADAGAGTGPGVGSAAEVEPSLEGTTASLSASSSLTASSSPSPSLPFVRDRPSPSSSKKKGKGKGGDPKGASGDPKAPHTSAPSAGLSPGDAKGRDESKGGSAGPAPANGEGGNAGGRKSKHVAILRDRDKERMDPDFRRGLDRFSQRFDPGFGMMQDPSHAPYGAAPQPLYAPVMTYNTEFPALGPGNPNQYQHQHQHQHQLQMQQQHHQQQHQQQHYQQNHQQHHQQQQHQRGMVPQHTMGGLNHGHTTGVAMVGHQPGMQALRPGSTGGLTAGAGVHPAATRGAAAGRPGATPGVHQGQTHGMDPHPRPHVGLGPPIGQAARALAQAGGVAYMTQGAPGAPQMWQMHPGGGLVAGVVGPGFPANPTGPAPEGFAYGVPHVGVYGPFVRGPHPGAVSPYAMYGVGLQPGAAGAMPQGIPGGMQGGMQFVQMGHRPYGHEMVHQTSAAGAEQPRPQNQQSQPQQQLQAAPQQQQEAQQPPQQQQGGQQEQEQEKKP